MMYFSPEDPFKGAKGQFKYFSPLLALLIQPNKFNTFVGDLNISPQRV